MWLGWAMGSSGAGSGGGAGRQDQALQFDRSYQTSIADRQAQMDKLEQDMTLLLNIIRDINALTYVQGEHLDTIGEAVQDVVDLSEAGASAVETVSRRTRPSHLDGHPPWHTSPNCLLSPKPAHASDQASLRGIGVCCRGRMCAHGREGLGVRVLL